MRSAEIVGFFVSVARVSCADACHIPSAIFTAARASNAVES